ncbi:hypothetical protein [Verminephrobacter aporrectodeae]|uniref:hypothetical protein n=1 Tax=Verminephrobacter aporrectodeae TaxID=1110389 RepID=UPI002237716F|nr:hypothetical protein [Verminephrobacter aporrectodeae]
MSVIAPVIAAAGGSAAVLFQLFRSEASQFWGSQITTNNPSDAFRHAYVSAIFSQHLKNAFCSDASNGWLPGGTTGMLDEFADASS